MSEIDDQWWVETFGKYWIPLDASGDVEMYKPIGKPPEFHVDAEGGGVVSIPIKNASRQDVLDFIGLFKSLFGEGEGE